jgi:HD-GYP domain-containing protein (c-di-GMP phosphodiesterase class II)
LAVKEDRELISSAKDIINQLSIILRTANIHSPSNIAVTTAIEKYIALLNPLIKSEQSILLELIGEFFYINSMRIRYSLDYLINFNFLVREFKKREIGSVIFKDFMNPRDLQTFLKAFIESGFSDTPYDTMSEGIDALSSIKIDRLKKIKEGEDVDTNTRKIIKKTYFTAVAYIEGLFSKIEAGERVNIKKSKRIVEAMVDRLLDEEQLLIGMTAIKDYDEYTYYHMVNVSILSIALGQRLGLNKKLLAVLGITAIFHDIGKIGTPYEILNKPSSLTDDEWKIMKRHPIGGVRAILKLRGFDSTAIRSAIVSFEHHIHNDFSGYPSVSNYMDLDLYSKIVCIADQYDAMTSSRVYSRIPIPPDKAISIMMERSGTQLDPVLLKFFINMIGVFPIGTLVMLDTKELGLVFESNEVMGDRPKVVIVIDSNGNRLKGPVVSLAQKDETGRYLRTIVKTLDPNKYNINLAEYLL